MHRLIVQRPSANLFAYVTLALIVGPQGDEEAHECRALINTGSDHTIIRSDKLRAAGIALTDREVRFEGASSGGLARTAHALLGVTGLDDAGRHTNFVIDQEVGVVDDLRFEAVLGLDFLQHFEVEFGRDGRVTLTWERTSLDS